MTSGNRNAIEIAVKGSAQILARRRFCPVSSVARIEDLYDWRMRARSPRNIRGCRSWRDLAPDRPARQDWADSPSSGLVPAEKTPLKLAVETPESVFVTLARESGVSDIRGEDRDPDLLLRLTQATSHRFAGAEMSTDGRIEHRRVMCPWPCFAAAGAGIAVAVAPAHDPDVDRRCQSPSRWTSGPALLDTGRFSAQVTTSNSSFGSCATVMPDHSLCRETKAAAENPAAHRCIVCPKVH